MILSLDGDGSLTEVNGNNTPPPTANTWERIAAFFNSVIIGIMVLFGII